MKSTIKALLTVLLFFLSQPSMAQWRFHAEVFPSDECENTLEGKISRAAAIAMCSDRNSRTWRTEQECNKIRQECLRFNQDAYTYCRIVVKASPCQCSGNTDRVNGNHSSTSRENNSQQAMLAKKRAAKESARRKAEAERIRKERERQRKYNEALQKGYQQTSAAYTTMHKETAYRSGEGYERMMLTVPVGTERIQSSYIPSETVVNPADIDEIIARRTYSQFEAIRLLPDNYRASNTGQSAYFDFDAAFERLMKYEKEREEEEKKRPDYLVWKQLNSQLEDGQRAFIISMIRDKNGDIPQYIGFKDNNYYFKSFDGKKIFKISSDGDKIFEYEFNDNFWNEDNIVKKIKEGSIKQYLEESYSLKYNEIKPMLDFDGLAKNGVKELTSLAPKIKADLQMVIIDKSRTKYSRGYYIPESVDFPLPSSISLPVVGSMGLPTSVNLVFGYSGSASSGRNITANASVNASLTGVGASAGIKISDAELNGKVQQGAVITCGKKQYWVTFDASVSIGAGASAGVNASASLSKFEAKVNLGFPVYLGAGAKLVFKDLTPNDEYDL